MESVFLKYGSSTKRGTNEQTGGFGLGAKTPFAYTDSFVIKTVNEGVQYVYNAIIDRTGKGKMILLSETPTEAHSGTEIIIPILSNDDRFKFEREVYKSTMYWNTVTYLNFRLPKPEIEIVLEDKNFKIAKNTQLGNFVGLLDGIPYEIKSAITGITGYTVFLNLDIEKLTINANRETLQYDDNTNAEVRDKENLFVEELKKKIQDYLNDNKTFSEAYNKYRSMSNRHNVSGIAEIIGQLKYWKPSGYGVADYIVEFEGKQVNRISFLHHQILHVKELTKGSFKYNPLNSLELDHTVVYYDKGRLSVDKNKKLQDFIMIKPIKDENKKEEIQKEKDYLFSLGIDIELYSEVKADKIYVRKPKSDKVKIYLRGAESPYFDKYEVKFDKILKIIDGMDSEEVAFIVKDNFKGYFPSSPKDKISLVKHEKKVKNVYYVSQTSYDKYLKNNGFKTLEEVFATVDLTKFSGFLEKEKIEQVLSVVPKILLEHCPEILPKNIRVLADRKPQQIPNQLRNVNWRMFGIKKSAFDYDGLINKYHKILEEKYPMLRPYLNYSNHNEEITIKNIKNYISKI